MPKIAKKPAPIEEATPIHTNPKIIATSEKIKLTNDVSRPGLTLCISDQLDNCLPINIISVTIMHIR